MSSFAFPRYSRLEFNEMVRRLDWEERFFFATLFGERCLDFLEELEFGEQKETKRAVLLAPPSSTGRVMAAVIAMTANLKHLVIDLQCYAPPIARLSQRPLEALGRCEVLQHLTLSHVRLCKSDIAALRALFRRRSLKHLNVFNGFRLYNGPNRDYFLKSLPRSLTHLKINKIPKNFDMRQLVRRCADLTSCKVKDTSNLSLQNLLCLASLNASDEERSRVLCLKPALQRFLAQRF